MEQHITISASRVGPERMRPISFEGKRYEQVLNGELLGLSQRTGLMVVYDDASNTRLCIVSIYDQLREPMLEADVQDVFFTRFELDEAKREILIENERHRRFVYGIDDARVRIVQ